MKKSRKTGRPSSAIPVKGARANATRAALRRKPAGTPDHSTGGDVSTPPPRTSSGAAVTPQRASDAPKAPGNPKHLTPKKGHPTPKRAEQEIKAGVRRPPVEAPATASEARRRRKELRKSMSKEDYKALRRRERDEAAAKRRHINERMMAGDERYLLERDKGPERQFVRDWVDSHRYIMNLFLPLTLVVIVVMIIGLRNPVFANLVSIAMMVIFVIMVIEGLVLGRKLTALVNQRFPHNPHSGFSLGLYAFTRATMIRRFRTPAPRVAVGDDIAA